MSQYRDDRAAAQLRIEALEARLAEREAELSTQGAQLAARDEEIQRLERDLACAGVLGPRRMRSMNAAWASRIVGMASALGVATAATGGWLARSVPVVAPAQAAVEQPALEPPEAINADPLVGNGLDYTPPSDSAETENRVRRELEQRVWGDRASVDDARMLKAICRHQSDRACMERARAALDRARRRAP
jgi:hypothetical protein